MIRRAGYRNQHACAAPLQRVAAICTALWLAACGSSGAGSGKNGPQASSGAGSGGNASTAGSSGSSGTNAATCTISAEPGELVQVPAGDFTMGCNDSVDAACADDEKPMHTVSLVAFQIDRTEVTQAQYTACVAAGACDQPSCAWNCDNPSFPASCVAWAQADAYCGWASERLPTEAEWEKAARGDQGNKYPWGNGEPDCTLSNMAGCGNEAMAVGSLAAGASPYGALDMAGNMVELVADWYDKAYYASSPAADPAGPASGTRYGGRGGGFKSDADFLRTSKRDWYDTTDAGASLGFRCAR